MLSLTNVEKIWIPEYLRAISADPLLVDKKVVGILVGTKSD